MKKAREKIIIIMLSKSLYGINIWLFRTLLLICVLSKWDDKNLFLTVEMFC